MIGAQPLIEVVPLQQKGADQEVVTQFSMKNVEALGLLKIDFLGLRNLDVIDKALELIPEQVDIGAIPLDDRKTYEMLARAESNGVFQFESSGMREALRAGQADRVRGPDRARRALPAGADGATSRPTRGARTAWSRSATSTSGCSRSPSDSYGICIYQEQYMQIAKQIAGFSPAEAETLRRAIGKKIHALMASLKDKFLEGCAANDVTPAVAQQLWKDMESSQDYSFNKAHSACYALIAYRTAWLKANHPCEYMAALISSVMNTKDRVPVYVNACREMGIEVLPPDVNSSECDFAVVEGQIRFGLNAVKGVGDSAARAIIRAREEGGPFESMWDFTERVDPQVVNKRSLESLIKCGALDSTGASRRGMLEAVEQALALGQRHIADRLAGQGSIFDLGLDAGQARGAAAAPPGHLRRRVREEGAARLREGKPRPLRLRASAAGRCRDAAQEDRLPARAARAAPRRRDRHGGRDRRLAQAADDEEGRPDGLPDAGGPDGELRGRRLQLRLRGVAGAAGARPDPRRQGPRRPQERGRDEADRHRGGRARRSRRSAARCACASTLGARARASCASWRR